MNIWRTLFWKEAHEQKWKLLALCSIVVSILIAGSIGDRWDGYDLALVTVVYGYALVGPLFVAMNVGSGERSNGSIAFVNAMPILTWKYGVVRILVGWLVLVTPLIAIALFSQLYVGLTGTHGSKILGQLAGQLGVSVNVAAVVMTTLAVGISTNIYAWILLATVNQKTELRAGLIGLVTTVLILLTAIWTVDHDAGSGTSIIHEVCTWILMAGSGTLWTMRYNDGNYLASTHLESVIVHAMVIGGLLTLTARRYGQQPLLQLNRSHRSSLESMMPSARRTHPFSSARAALLWMQYRQSLPIAVCGATIMLLIVCIERDSQRGNILVGLGPFFGGILALVIGAGAFAHQLEPELHTFWRSRPICPRQWFWLKYLAGALVLVVCYDIPMFFLEVAVTRGMNISPNIVFATLLHLFAYSMAVLAACGVRHTAYSAILAAAAVVVVIFPPLVFVHFPKALSFMGMWEDATYRHIGNTVWGNIADATILLGPLIVCSTLCAAWLVKRDISVAH